MSLKFQVNELVFAKVRGYPWWPAKVISVDKGRYNVYFYGTKETGYVKKDDLCPYYENKERLGKANKNKFLIDAIVQIEEEFDSLHEEAKLESKEKDDEENLVKTATTRKRKLPKADLESETSKIKKIKPEKVDEIEEALMKETENSPAKKAVRKVNAEDEEKTTANSRKEKKIKTQKTDEIEEKVLKESENESVLDENEVKDDNTSAKTAANSRKVKKIKPQKDDEIEEKVLKGSDNEAVSPSMESLDKTRKKKIHDVAKDNENKMFKTEVLDENEMKDNSAKTANSRKVKKIRPQKVDEIEEKVLKESENEAVAISSSMERLGKTRKKKVEVVEDNENESIEEEIEDNVPEEKQRKTKKMNIPKSMMPVVALKKISDEIGWVGTTEQSNIISRSGRKLKPTKKAEDKTEKEQKQSSKKITKTPSDVLKNQTFKEIMENNEPAIFDIDKEYIAVEKELVDLTFDLMGSVTLNNVNAEVALDCLAKLAELKITPLMLKKYPTAVHAVTQLSHYVGPKNSTINSNTVRAIRQRAEQVFNNFRKLFIVPIHADFWNFFKKEEEEFKNATKDLSCLEYFKLKDEFI